MAQTKQELKEIMTKQFMEIDSVQKGYGFTAGTAFDDYFLPTSLESILFDICSTGLYLLDKIYDRHQATIDKALLARKSGTLRWYKTMALRFQYGFPLLPDSDKFDNKDAADADIEASKVVKHAAVEENMAGAPLVVKIAGETDGELKKLPPEVENSFKAYIDRIKYAGIPVTVINKEPDRLRLYLQIYYDPLVLDDKGMSIANKNYPVKEAIQAYLKALPFNGELVLPHLIDRIQAAEGVVVPNLHRAETKEHDPNNLIPFAGMSLKTIPKSGYFKVESFDSEYIKYENKLKNPFTL